MPGDTGEHILAAFANADGDAETGRAGLQGARGLRDFLASIDRLTDAEQAAIVEQAVVLLESFYVHLPLKRAMHAVDPLQRLRLLHRRLPQLPNESAFHQEMTSIFTSLRDLHTNYVLPAPFTGMAAVLPFRVERCVLDGAQGGAGRAGYVVTAISGDPGHPRFVKGVEVTHWNGVPIARAVEIAASYHAGSNLEARHARGVDGLTARPMVISPPPDEEWIVVGFRDLQGEPQELRVDWKVTRVDQADGAAGLPLDHPTAAYLGVDVEGDAVRRIHELLFAPHVHDARRRIQAARARAMEAAAASGADAEAAAVAGARAEVRDLETTMPGVFAARVFQAGDRAVGHIRIRTFSVPDDVPFVDEFARLLEAPGLPQDGLVIDVRGNGGGLIWAGERLLQLLTPRTIEPCRLQFINTPLNAELCRAASEALGQWSRSLERAVETGAAFSAAYPITPPERCNDIGQRYYGPVVLVTDARCYSTTDIFAAGFQDHGIGEILGVDGNTGAGGANVWQLGLIRKFFIDGGRPSPLQPLPKGADMRVAIRRTLRVGPETGTELEDLGVVPDARHEMTRRDVLEDNADLLTRAAGLLAGQAACRFEVVSRREGQRISLELRTAGVDRVDVYAGGRPRTSEIVREGASRIELTEPAGTRLDLRGFKGELLTCRRSLVA